MIFRILIQSIDNYSNINLDVSIRIQKKIEQRVLERQARNIRECSCSRQFKGILWMMLIWKGNTCLTQLKRVYYNHIVLNKGMGKKPALKVLEKMPTYLTRLQQIVHFIPAKDSFTIIAACKKQTYSLLSKNEFGLLYLKKSKFHKIGFLTQLDQSTKLPFTVLPDVDNKSIEINYVDRVSCNINRLEIQFILKGQQGSWKFQIPCQQLFDQFVKNMKEHFNLTKKQDKAWQSSYKEDVKQYIFEQMSQYSSEMFLSTEQARYLERNQFIQKLEKVMNWLDHDSILTLLTIRQASAEFREQELKKYMKLFDQLKNEIKGKDQTIKSLENQLINSKSQAQQIRSEDKNYIQRIFINGVEEQNAFKINLISQSVNLFTSLSNLSLSQLQSAEVIMQFGKSSHDKEQQAQEGERSDLL